MREEWRNIINFSVNWRRKHTVAVEKLDGKKNWKPRVFFFIRGIDSIKSVAVAHAPGVVEWVD